MAPLKPPRQRKVPAAQQALDLREPGQPTIGEVTSWYTREYLSGSGNGEEQLGLSMRRGCKSTFKQALAFFGRDATPTKGAARAWLRPLLDSEGGTLRARTVNAHRDRLHTAYVKYRDEVLGITLNPWSFTRFREDTKHLRTSFDAIAEVWPKLLAAMPDDRARLFLSLLFRLGWRLSEPLGLEWGHIMRTTQGTWVVRKEQQRAMWKNVPRGMKHDGLVGTFELHPEMVQFLSGTRRALDRGEPLFGCERGTLVGDRAGTDGAVRSFLFPYREDHLAELTQRLRAAAPDEFPKGQAWHRLRRAFARHTASTQGMEAANRLLGHAYFTSTQLYCRDVVGVVATGQDIQKLYAAQDQNMVCAEAHEADTMLGADS